MRVFDVVLGLLLCSLVAATHSTEPPLHAKVRQVVAANASCDKIARCGQYVEVNCHPEVDGSLNYYDNTTGEELMKCGGTCDSPSRVSSDPQACKACPPPQWKACQKK